MDVVFSDPERAEFVRDVEEVLLVKTGVVFDAVEATCVSVGDVGDEGDVGDVGDEGGVVGGRVGLIPLDPAASGR